jgi:hypothetical protein
MNKKDSNLLAEAYENVLKEAYAGSSLESSFNDEQSPLVKILYKASMYTGSSDKDISLANIASKLAGLLSGKDGELTPQEKSILEDMGKTLMNMK